MGTSDLVAVIPGASRSVGRAIAHMFGQSGAHLVIPIYSDWPDSAQEMQDEFDQAGYSFHTVSSDLRRQSDTQHLASEIESRFGQLHVLINNIERGGMPIVHGSYAHSHNQDQWTLEMETSVKAKWNLFSACLPLLKKSGNGVVLNISSIAGIIGRSGPASLLFSDGYSAANRAIASLTEQWAREGAPEVRVNELMLGLIQGRHAEQTRGWQELTDSQRNDLVRRTLLQRTGTPQEVAELVFHITMHVPFLTGSVIRLDGGYCLGSEPVHPMPPGILPD